MKKITQDAGKKQLGDFAPDFAHFNDDVLFGENWNNLDIDLKTRCIITVVSLMSSGITDSSLIYHLQNAKVNGVSKKEIAAIITHCGFYVVCQKLGQFLGLLKMFGMKKSLKIVKKMNIKTLLCFQLEIKMMHSKNTLLVKVIWHQFLHLKLVYTM